MARHSLAGRGSADGVDGVPVANPACPATGMAPTGFFVNGLALREGGEIQALVALDRGDEPDDGMAMLMVAPLREGMDPTQGFLKAAEAVHRIVRAVRAGTEQRLGEGVAVGNPRTAVRGRDAEPFPCRGASPTLRRICPLEASTVPAESESRHRNSSTPSLAPEKRWSKSLEFLHTIKALRQPWSVAARWIPQSRNTIQAVRAQACSRALAKHPVNAGGAACKRNDGRNRSVPSLTWLCDPRSVVFSR